MMDKTTLHFVAYHSCWVWFNLRVQYTCKLLAGAGVLSCLFLKGQTSNTTLCLVLTYTLDLDWLHHLIGCFNWLERTMMDCEKLFNLTKIEQEKE